MKNKSISQKKFLFILFIVAALLAGCKPSIQGNDFKENSIQVTVSIPPQAYFVERISGGIVEVNLMVEPGEEAHTYEPKPEQMRTLAESQAFFTIGLEYEAAWVPRFQDINPDLKVIDSTKGIQRIPLSTDHTHPDGEDNHDEEEDNIEKAEEHLDPHVWLSPKNGKIIAENTLFALRDLFPESAEIFQENYNALIADIDTVERRISTALDALEQRQFMVFHPAWGYFAEAYNLQQLPVQVGGQDPSAGELALLVKIAQEQNIKVIFIQPNFNTASAKALAEEIGAEVAIVDPLSRDWLSNLESAADAFASALNN